MTPTSEAAARLESARRDTRALMGALGVERVVLVDDQAVPAADLFKRAFADPGKVPALAGQRPSESLDAEGVGEWVDEVWRDLSTTDRQKAHVRALKELSPMVGGDPLDILAVLVSPDLLTRCLPDEWLEQGKGIVEKKGSDKTLVLFDMNLGPGFRQEGLRLYKDYLYAYPQAVAAILTKDVPIDEEIEQEAPLAGVAGIPPDRMIVSSKAHLTPTGAHEFVNVLRLTANGPRISELRAKFVEGLEHDSGRVKAKMDRMSTRVLEDLVFRSSASEGAWEGDTLARVASLFGREAARRRLLGDHAIMDLIGAARTLANISRSDHRESAQAAAELMSSERWEPPEYVNGLCLPLANGDVFRIGGKTYVLVEQPCNLIIRPDGHRNRRPETVTLLPVGFELGKRPGEELPPGSPLDQDGESLCAYFRPAHHAPFEVLDLCTFDQQGRAWLDVVQQPSVEPLTPGLKARREQLVANAKKRLAVWDQARKVVSGRSWSKDIRGSLLGFSSDLPFSGDVDRRVRTRIRYDCRRVARLTEAHANALLTAYLGEQSRTALEHDLGGFNASRAPQASRV